MCNRMEQSSWQSHLANLVASLTLAASNMAWVGNGYTDYFPLLHCTLSARHAVCPYIMQDANLLLISCWSQRLIMRAKALLPRQIIWKVMCFRIPYRKKVSRLGVSFAKLCAAVYILHGGRCGLFAQAHG
jgi:hypothetical protein